MKSAVVTGASSGIGLEITKRLLKMDFFVYAVARDFSKSNLEHERLSKIICDLRDSKSLKNTFEDLNKKDKNIHLLISNAGAGLFGLHEELNLNKLEDMMLVNLVAPVLITRILLRQIKENKGYLINISSVTAKKSSPIAAAYSATKAGITQFGDSLFEEVRKSGAKVVNIHPDMTKTNFYNSLSIKENEDPESYLEPGLIADVVENILNLKSGIITDITIRPGKHKFARKK